MQFYLYSFSVCLIRSERVLYLLPLLHSLFYISPLAFLPYHSLSEHSISKFWETDTHRVRGLTQLDCVPVPNLYGLCSCWENGNVVRAKSQRPDITAVASNGYLGCTDSLWDLCWQVQVVQLNDVVLEQHYNLQLSFWRENQVKWPVWLDKIRAVHRGNKTKCRHDQISRTNDKEEHRQSAGHK